MSYPIQAKYDEFNRRYFKGSLPQIPLYMKPLKGAAGVVRFRTYKAAGTSAAYQLKEGSVSLTLSTLFKRTAAEIDAVLIHEMIHVHFVNIGDYVEQHGSKFMAERNRISRESGILIPITERNTGDIDLTSAKTKPYGVLLIKNTDGRYSYGVLSMAAMSQVDAIKEKWVGRALYGRFGVALYTIDTLLWTSQAMKVPVSRGEPKNLYVLKEELLVQDLFKNGNLVFSVEERPK